MIYGDKIIDDVVLNFFDTGIIKVHDNIIIALSGGMDSMCLLDVFIKLQYEFEFKLYAIHINHGIRGPEAVRDMDFVKKYCKSMDIKLFIKNIDAKAYSINKKLSLEEAARILRYREFEKIHKEFAKKKTTHILLAHHSKDQAETVIHNIVRGTGIKGLIGMKAVSNYIVRPFLYSSKEDIIDYIKSYDIPYVNDSSNNDIVFTRNYIRSEILPRILKINDKGLEHINDLSKELEEIDRYIDSVSKYAYEHILKSEDKNEIIIKLPKFNLLSDLIKSSVIKIIISKLVKSLKDISRIHIDSIIKSSVKNKGLHIDLPYNITYDKRHDDMIFKKNNINISMNRRKTV